MPKTHHKYLTSLLFLLLVLLFLSHGIAQDIPVQKKMLISYIQELESTFNIKFSYVDDDIRHIQIIAPKGIVLEEVIADILNQTQIKIQKLNERYYTVSKSTTVDICAIVLDNFKNNTLSGASIEILGSSIGVITNKDGAFSFKNIPRKAIIQIKYLGFKPLFITAQELANSEPCTTLLLAQSYQQLEEVIIYQFLTTGLIKQADGSIELNTAQFGILPGLIEPDVLQTLQALPGIKSIDETVSDINIRGGSNDQNLILWDGIKMYQSGHFFGLISAFNPYLTDKVTLIKNGTSAQYGDGVSGVIDMRTKNTIGDALWGGAGFNLISGDVFGHLPIGNSLAFQFSARRSMTDFFNTPTYDKFFDKVFEDSQVTRNSNFYFYDFTGKILYDINPDQKIRFSFININNKLDYSETNEDSFRSTQSTLNQSNISFGGSLESNWNNSFSTLINAYYTKYNLDATNTSSNFQQTLLQGNEVIETAIKFASDLQLSNTLNWHNGYQLSETGIGNKTDVTQPPYKSNIKGVLRTHSLFSEIGYESPNEKLKARGGVRLNYFKDLKTYKTFEEFIVEPRMNVNYTIAKNFKAEILGEFKSQATNQIVDLEQNFLGIEKRRWILSDNDSLPITESKQLSLGFNYDHHSLYIGIEGFYKEVKGISASTQGFQNQDQFNGEIGKYDIRGIEFLINKKTANYSTWLSYTFNVNNYTFKDIEPNQFPNNLDIRHTFTFAGTYTFKGIKIGVGFNYRTGKPYTQPDNINPLDTTFFPYRIQYSEPNSNRLPEYFRADASVIYDFNIGAKIKASVGASVLNFTDRINILNTYYRLSPDNEIERVKNISLGLTPNVNFRMRF
ncbi:MAG: TonB-dependent receptor plug domain-containing protein [Flavobacteriaceae bacterium]